MSRLGEKSSVKFKNVSNSSIFVWEIPTYSSKKTGVTINKGDTVLVEQGSQVIDKDGYTFMRLFDATGYIIIKYSSGTIIYEEVIDNAVKVVEVTLNTASPIKQNPFSFTSTVTSPAVLTSTSTLTGGIVRLIVVDNNGSVKGCPCLYEAKLTSKHTGTRFYIGDVVEFRQGSEVDVHEFKVINTYMQLAEDSCYMRIRCTVSHDTTVFLTILDN